MHPSDLQQYGQNLLKEYQSWLIDQTLEVDRHDWKPAIALLEELPDDLQFLHNLAYQWQDIALDLAVHWPSQEKSSKLLDNRSKQMGRTSSERLEVRSPQGQQPIVTNTAPSNLESEKNQDTLEPERYDPARSKSADRLEAKALKIKDRKSVV